jgi:rhodanese-related sulfurtransferase
VFENHLNIKQEKTRGAYLDRQPNLTASPATRRAISAIITILRTARRDWHNSCSTKVDGAAPVDVERRPKILESSRRTTVIPVCVRNQINQNESKFMKNLKNLLAVVLSLSMGMSLALAQQSAPASGAAAAAAQPWTYKTKQLSRAQIDALLANPQKVIVIDVRRPDEVVSKGSFPVFLNIQADDLKNSLAYIPKDRAIITVSNRAHRAGAAGDLLVSNGFNVAGAAGSQDYEDQGGTINRIAPPPPKKQ